MKRYTLVSAAAIGLAMLFAAGCSNSGSSSSANKESASAAPAKQAPPSAPAKQAEPAAAKGDSAPLAHLLPDDIRQKGSIVAGGLMVVPPIGFYTKSGAPAGVNVDMAAAMGKELGIKISFKQYNFAGLQPALKSGQIDIIWDSIHDTPPREKILDFIDYLKSGDTLLLPNGNPKHVESLADTCGLTIGTVRGAAQIKRVKAGSAACTAHGKPAITLKLYANAGDARLQAKTGRIDAFIGNGPVLLYLAKTADNGNAFDAVKLGSGGHQSYYGIAFRKSQSKLRDAFKAAFAKIIASGQYQQILTKYGLANLAVKQPMINAVGSQ